MLPVIASCGKFCELRRAPLTLLFLAALLACLPAPAASRGADISNADFIWVESAGALTVHTNAGTTAWRSALSHGTGFFSSPTGLYFQYDSYSQVRSVSIGPAITEIGDFAFFGCDKLARADVPEGVTSVGYGAFEFCLELTSVSLPDSVTHIGSEAFEYCPKLASVSLPAGLRRIGFSTFWGCTSLSSVALPAGLEEIGDSAFSDYASLTSLTLPETLRRIESSAFFLSGLATLAFEGMAAPTLDTGALSGLPSLTTIYVPEGASGYGGGNWPGAPIAYVQVPLPRFTLQPRDATANPGQAAGFTASASNPVPAYPTRCQWQLSRDGGRTWADPRRNGNGLRNRPRNPANDRLALPLPGAQPARRRLRRLRRRRADGDRRAPADRRAAAAAQDRRRRAPRALARPRAARPGRLCRRPAPPPGLPLRELAGPWGEGRRTLGVSPLKPRQGLRP